MVMAYVGNVVVIAAVRAVGEGAVREVAFDHRVVGTVWVREVPAPGGAD